MRLDDGQGGVALEATRTGGAVPRGKAKVTGTKVGLMCPRKQEGTELFSSSQMY